MKAYFVTLTALLMLLSASEARAQMTVDVAKITCRQYLFDRTFSPRAPMIANWLSGYFNGQKNNTVVDLGTMAKNKDKVEDYCRLNQDVTLIEAAKQQGYEVTSIEIAADGGVRLGLRRPGERDKTVETPEDLRAQL